MKITWIQCSERMPPDDDTLIICTYGRGLVDKMSATIFHAACKLSYAVNGDTNIRWIPYTEETWRELNDTRN